MYSFCSFIDLKPANIMFGTLPGETENRMLLVDFMVFGRDTIRTKAVNFITRNPHVPHSEVGAKQQARENLW